MSGGLVLLVAPAIAAAYSQGCWEALALAQRVEISTKGGKLVRDRIPDMIREQGRIPVVRTLDELSYIDALCAKLHEEVSEYTTSRSLDELADVLEVVHELAKVHGVTMDHIDVIRSRKKDERGGFSRRLFLEDIT